MFTSSGSTGGGGCGRGGNGDAKTIISPNPSFGDIIRQFAMDFTSGGGHSRF